MGRFYPSSEQDALLNVLQERVSVKCRRFEDSLACVYDPKDQKSTSSRRKAISKQNELENMVLESVSAYAWRLEGSSVHI